VASTAVTAEHMTAVRTEMVAEYMMVVRTEMAAEHMMVVRTEMTTEHMTVERMEMAAEYMTAVRMAVAVDQHVEGLSPSFCPAVYIESESPVLLVENCPESYFPFVEYDPSDCSVISTYSPIYYPAY